MSNLTPYQEKAIDYNKHISLVANAGSGKTHVLVNRFVEIYLKEQVNINEIVAITFTDKAAGELKRKISNYVNEQIQIETEHTFKQKLIKLKSELVEANISTIHSFCKNLLDEYSTEAEVDASFTLIDESLAQELKEISVEETLQKLLNNQINNSDIKKIIRVFASKNILREELIHALDKRRIIENLFEYVYQYDENYISNWIDLKYDELFTNYFEDLINKFIDSIKVVNNYILIKNPVNEIANVVASLLNKELNTFQNKLEFLIGVKEKIFTKSKPPKLFIKGYTSIIKDDLDEILFINKHVKDLYEIFIYYDKKIYHKKLAEIGKLLISLMFEINKNYESKKKQKSYLDFEDLLLISKKILQIKEVQKSLQSKYKFIMIDEYQDTNTLQYEIIMPILEDLKKGNLFVVGDEKQSIYSFLDAELEVFELTKNQIKRENDYGLLFLPHSFRMQSRLILFINNMFEKLFENPKKEFNEVEYKKLISTKNDLTKGSVGILISDGKNNISEETLVAKKILEIVRIKKRYSFKDIAILCRKRKSFKKLEEEFVKHRIPFNIVGGKGFYQQQTIYDIYNFLSFILNPNNDASLVGILRSPLFNYSDLEIFKISKWNGNTFYEKLKNYSNTSIRHKYTIDILEKNITHSKSFSVEKIIRNILIDTQYWSFISSKENSEQEIANVEKLISIARDFNTQPFKNLYDFVIKLSSLIKKEEDEGQAPISDDQNSVKIMTIHQSKGLEFPIVFLFDTNSRTFRNSVKEKTFSMDKNFGVITKIPVDNYFEKYSQTPIGSIYEYSAKRKNVAEIKRLFYVAATRAQDELYISASVMKNRIESNSFFEMLNSVYNVMDNKIVFISDEIEIMLQENNYESKKEHCELEIKVEREIQDSTLENELTEIKSYDKIFLQKIFDKPKDEIISATKIAIYEQCPVKYQLTYEIGFQPILEIIKYRENQYEYQPNEDENILQSKIRGKVIHKILSRENHEKRLNDFLVQELKRENIENKNVYDSILKDLEQFFKSNIYNDFKNYSNYKNEYEIYSKQNNYILYGIIDKLIINQDELIIIDYKTDNISTDEITERANNYFPQLKFYAIVLKNLYPDIKNYTLQLIFIKHPDEKVIKKINHKEIIEYEEKVKASVEEIYKQKYVPNKKHCHFCHYFLEGKTCVKEYQL